MKSSVGRLQCLPKVNIRILSFAVEFKQYGNHGRKESDVQRVQ